jgi:hypothetical protein
MDNMIIFDMLEQRLSLATARAVGILFDNIPVSAQRRAAIVSAIDVQVNRDLAPAWNIHATVNGYTKLRQIPKGVWVVDVSFHGFNYGIHYTQNNVPRASVLFQSGYTYGISHEVLEMLVDPYLNRYSSRGVLEEVCDPLDLRSYKINNIRVARFVTPAYFQ